MGGRRQSRDALGQRRTGGDKGGCRLLEPDGPAVWDTWGHLKLLPQDAKTLQLEIASLLGRYRSKVVHEGRNEYIVRLAMAPLKQ